MTNAMPVTKSTVTIKDKCSAKVQSFYQGYQ